MKPLLYQRGKALTACLLRCILQGVGATGCCTQDDACGLASTAAEWTEWNVMVDEHWYVATYEEARAALVAGRVRTAEEHYERIGKHAGYLSELPNSEENRIFVHGAYGTHNVGDEAIFDGVRLCYPGAIQLFINQPRVAGGLNVYSVLRGKHPFRATDRLIIGGGGLLYDRPAVQVMVDVAKQMRAAGGRVDVLGIGAESARAEYYDLIRELVSLAEKVTVRSTISQQIMRDITGADCQRQEDFALSLPAPPRSIAHPDWVIPTVGVVTGGNYNEDITSLASVLQTYTGPHAPGGRVHFMHIPHSMSRVFPANNDVIVGYKLGSSFHRYADHRHMFFHMAPFTEDPAEALRLYATLDGVITRRFHGMVFAHLIGIPVLVLHANLLKNRSFIEDYPREDMFTVADQDNIAEPFGEFIACVRRKREEALARYVATNNLGR